MYKKYSGSIFLFFFIFFCVFAPFVLSLDAQTTADNAYKLKTVTIDAGHGGKDPGAPGKHTNEKDIVLAIALKAGQYIEQNCPGVKVIYTRKTDKFVDLIERAKIANNNHADLFISIHANGLTNPNVTGTESYVLGLHRAGENFEVAKRENSVIQLEDDYSTKYEGFNPNDPESYIIFSLMQNLYFEQSINLAALVQDQFREKAHRSDRGVKQAGLLVLAQTAMPGILIETGFISNPDEEKYLMSEQGQDYLASAIYRAFKSYKNIIESKNSFAIASKNGKALPTTDSIKEEKESNKPTDSITEKTPQEAIVPASSSVRFKVQIAASSKQIAIKSNTFKGLNDVTEYHVGNIYKYAVGGMQTFQEIIPYSRQIKERFPDAFIIAVKDDKIIPLDQALKETQNMSSNN
jgi:N-acetylmuramoyl-L-alanine amidase